MKKKILTTLWPEISTEDTFSSQKLCLYDIDKSEKYLKKILNEYYKDNVLTKAMLVRDPSEKVEGGVLRNLAALAQASILTAFNKVIGKAPYNRFVSFKKDNNDEYKLDIFDKKIPKKGVKSLQYNQNHDKGGKPFYRNSIVKDGGNNQFIIYDPKLIDFMKKNMSADKVDVVKDYEYYEKMMVEHGRNTEWKKWVSEERLNKDTTFELRK